MRGYLKVSSSHQPKKGIHDFYQKMEVIQPHYAIQRQKNSSYCSKNNASHLPRKQVIDQQIQVIVRQIQVIGEK